MPKTLKIEGLKYGRLTIIKEVRKVPGNCIVLCKCNCGVEKEFYLGNLKGGRTKSCGCLHKELVVQRSTGRVATNESRKRMSDSQKKRTDLRKAGYIWPEGAQEKAWESNRIRIRPLSEIEKRNLLYKRGSDNPAWKGGTSQNYNKNRKGPGTKRWRRLVLERDDYTCQDCGEKDTELHSHHIKSYANNPELRLDVKNGITLCLHCHAKAHLWSKIMKQRSEQFRKTA